MYEFVCKRFQLTNQINIVVGRQIAIVKRKAIAVRHVNRQRK